jgi:hypothetical protein
VRIDAPLFILHITFLDTIIEGQKQRKTKLGKSTKKKRQIDSSPQDKNSKQPTQQNDSKLIRPIFV